MTSKGTLVCLAILLFGHSLVARNSDVMFTKSERQKIMKAYNQILEDKRIQCSDQPRDLVELAASGMFLYANIVDEKIEKLCKNIADAWRKQQDPIIKEDSIAAWGKIAVEKHGLTVGDIIHLEPGAKLELIFMDPMVQVFFDNLYYPGRSYDPKNEGLVYATYTHESGLSGTISMSDFTGGTNESKMQWRVNTKKSGSNRFWSYLAKGTNVYDIDENILVGSNCPAIKQESARDMPEQVVFHKGLWNNKLPFETVDFSYRNK